MVLAAAAATGATLHLVAGTADSAPQAVLLVQLATAAGAAIVALQCGFLAQLLGDRRLVSVATAWAFYGLVVMPFSALHNQTTPLRATWVAGQVMFLALLASGLRRGTATRLPPLLVGGLATLLTGLLATAAALLPTPVTAVLDTRAPDGAALIGLTVLAAGFAARGILHREPVWWRLGFGIGLEAAARFNHLTTTDDAAGEGLRFVVLRLLGFLVLVVGLGFRVRQANRGLRAQRAAEQERAAALERSRVSRDHEIRNALSNLAAITILAGGNRPEPGDVAESVTGELARLRDLLEDRADRGGGRTAPVDLVLRRLVLLRRASGLPVTLDCPAELNAAFPTDVLTEVLTNLLTNCERHAPGAAVHIEARRVDGRCRIDVMDTGPGLGTDAGGRTTGSGLGLALSSQLVINNGGGLRLLRASRGTGCTVRLDLPLANGEPLPGGGGRHGAPRHLARSGGEDAARRSAS